MKQMKIIIMTMCAVAMMGSFMSVAQDKAVDSRMDQDVAVAENILSTLMQQQYGRRAFFPTEVNGSYTPGYGVTFRMPQNGITNGGFLYKSYDLNPGQMEIFTPGGAFTYSVTEDEGRSSDEVQNTKAAKARIRQDHNGQKVTGIARTGPKAPRPPSPVSDSLSASANQRFLEVSKNFLADYGDVLSQLKADEKISITNRGEEFGGLSFNGFGNGYGWEAKRSMISVEAKREDIMQLKQGKISRDQFLKKLAVVNSESTDKLDPDLEVLSSMFNRLYREDLSKTYYSQGNIGYERLKDFGVIYYMRVYSSVEQGDDLFAIPTISVDNISQEERDKKVKELYPEFEKSLKDNLVDYGRTLRSLKEEELVTISVKMTKCVGCGIPGAVEISIKNAVLKDYSSGKITKEAALAKINVKKTGIQ